MKTEYGILLDKSVIISNCIGVSNQRNYHAEFFDYLEKHPFLGIMTKCIQRGCQEKLMERFSSNPHIMKRSYSMERLDEMPSFIRVENVTFSYFQNKLREVKRFFNELLKNERIERYSTPTSISPRFRGVIKNMYVNHTDPERKKLDEKALWRMPEEEDMKILAEAICLNYKYDPLFIASADYHFTGETVSRTIEKRFDIKCAFPTDVLSELETMVKKDLYTE